MAVILFGGAAACADARGSKSQAAGGAQAPGGTTGGTSATGVTGTTGAGTTGSTGVVPDSPLAPIVLAHGQSPTAVYSGPVYELTASGLVPFTPPLPADSSSNTLAGGTTATTSSVFLPELPQLEVPGSIAEEVQYNGLDIAAAPENAPLVVQQIIWTANEIIGRPYVYGGGHRSFKSFGYDCSGLVSFALHGGELLSAPLDSGQFMQWGAPGQGQWMTILTNPGHAYLDIAGLRLDTSPENDPSGLEGSRWRPLRPDNAGFVKRHPIGL
jgi:cell wall-associated NlpC family hydrolase